MKARHRAREVALQILYRYDMAKQSNGTPTPEGAELAKDLSRHFDHFQVTPDLREFAAQLVAGTLQTRAELDQLIESSVSNWKLNRLGFVDRSLLRMSAYEMKSFPETHVSIIIDEAIELGKQFGNEDTPAFVNGRAGCAESSLAPRRLSSPSGRPLTSIVKTLTHSPSFYFLNSQLLASSLLRRLHCKCDRTRERPLSYDS